MLVSVVALSVAFLPVLVGPPLPSSAAVRVVGATGPTITINPAEATHPVGWFEIVEATLQDGGTPLSQRLVTVGITGPSAGAQILCGAGVYPPCFSDNRGKLLIGYRSASVPGDDTLTASFVDDSGVRHEARAILHHIADSPASCTVTALRAGPPAQQDVTVRDADGISSISNVHVINGTVSVPHFTPGTKGPIVLTATKVDPTNRTFWGFDVTEGNGFTRSCN
jgi:hypothetical protein